MRISIRGLVLCLMLAGIGVVAGQGQSELIIDDFRESPYLEAFHNHPTFLTEYQTGPNIVGGVRQTSFTAVPAVPDFGQRTRLEIRNEGGLIVSGGYKSYFGLYLGYGYDTTGAARQLDLDLSGAGGQCFRCDRFRINFDGSDSELSHLMQVYDRNGNLATLNGTESTTGRTLPFHLDFRFADFVGDPLNPVDWEHIDYVFVLLQTGNELGGHDFALTRISAIPDPDR
jgi:hypothetical protein